MTVTFIIIFCLVALLGALTVFVLMLAKAGDLRKRLSDVQVELESGRQKLALAEEKVQAKADEAAHRLAEKDDELVRALVAKDQACARLLAEKEAACAKLLAEKDAAVLKLIQEKEKFFGETQKTLQEQFANLAAQKLKDQSGDLTALNKTQLESALKPLRDQVEHLKLLTKSAQDAQDNFGKSINRDVSAIEAVAARLSGVADALRSNTRVQGRSGEDILAEKLRQAGLEENVTFFLQEGTDAERPDAQVCDPENRWLVIDSKVSLTAYLDYCEADDAAVKQEKLRAHVASVRQKIDQLAKKKYPIELAKKNKDRTYLPVTAMFVPYEAPLMEALRADPTLWQFAAENNVFLVTPLTLLAYLRLVYLAWQQEKAARNQQEIVKTASTLLSRMNSFLKAFESVGEALNGVSRKYEEAQKVILDRQNAQSITKAAQKLIDLHVKIEGRKGNRIELADSLKETDVEEESEEGKDDGK